MHSMDRAPKVFNTDTQAMGYIDHICCPVCLRTHLRRNKESYKNFHARVMVHAKHYHPEHSLTWLISYPDPK